MALYAGFAVRDGEFYRQDVDVIEEVFTTDCYRLADLTLTAPKPLIIDIGAHIGAFSCAAKERWMQAEVLSVEACAENIPLLCANAPFSMVHAACYYAEEPVALLNSVFDGGKATGGSIVKTRSAVENEATDLQEYRKDFRELTALTLEQISGGRFIDLLKLDCEGAEQNILAHADVSQIGFIVGEFHERENWDRLIAERFAGWKYTLLDDLEEAGRFWLQNPARSTVTVKGKA